MGKEQPASYYDDLYNRVIKSGHPWGHVHKWAAQCCVGCESVLDIGCGPGWMVNHLDQTTYYLGIDFSAQALAQAPKRAWTSYMLGTLPDCLDGIFDNMMFDVIIATEVLEHIEDDLGVLAKMRPGQFVVASVPNFPDPAHVRTFMDETAIRDRYSGLLRTFSFKQLDVGRIGFVAWRYE